MRTFRFDVVCPFCKAEQPLATSLSGGSGGPVDGDVTMCFSCGRWSIFDHDSDGNLRIPTDAEMDEIGDDPEIQRATLAWIVNA